MVSSRTKEVLLTTLQALTRITLNYLLSKPDEIRRGDVFDFQLPEMSESALEYCARDVVAPLLLYFVYTQMENLTIRMKPEEIIVGQKIDLMSSQVTKR